MPAQSSSTHTRTDTIIIMRGIGLPIKIAEQKEDHIYDTNSVFTILVMSGLTLMHVWVYNSSTATCYCIFYVFDRTLFVLAWTPPPGLATSHVCLQSLLVYWLSHLAVGSGSVWTHMRTAPGTPGSETPSLPHRSAMNTFQWWGCLAHLLLGTWFWRLHTTASLCDTWSGRHQPDDPEVGIHVLRTLCLESIWQW